MSMRKLMGGKGGLVNASGMEGMIELSFSSLNERISMK